MKHFHSCHLTNVQLTASQTLEKILSLNIEIPLSDQYVRVFDNNGSFTGFRNSVISRTNDCTMNIHVETLENSTICNSSNMSVHVVDDSEIYCTPHQTSDVQTTSESPIVSTPYRTTIIEPIATCNNQELIPHKIDANSVHVVVGCEELGMDTTSTYEWKTTHGKALFKLLGFSKDLQVFDTVHYRLRQKQKAHLPLPLTDKRIYTQHLATFKLKYLKSCLS